MQGVIRLGTAGEYEFSKYRSELFVEECRIAVLLVKNTIPVRKLKASLTGSRVKNYEEAA